MRGAAKATSKSSTVGEGLAVEGLTLVGGAAEVRGTEAIGGRGRGCMANKPVEGRCNMQVSEQ